MAENQPTEDRPPNAVASPTERLPNARPTPSRPKPDGRFRAARRLRDLRRLICGQIGADYESLPPARQAAVDSAVRLMAVGEAQDAMLAQGVAIQPDEAVRVAGALQRALEALFGPSGDPAKPNPRAGLPTDEELRARGVQI